MYDCGTARNGKDLVFRVIAAQYRSDTEGAHGFLTLEYSEMEIVKRLKLSLLGASGKYLDVPVRRRPPENVVREMEKAGFCNKKEWDAYSMMKAAPVWIECGLVGRKCERDCQPDGTPPSGKQSEGALH